MRFLAPAGHVIEVFTGMEDAGPVHTGSGIQPRKFAHPMLTALESGPTVAFFLDVLGFRLSDDVGDGMLVFMRCNPDHHGVGVGLGPRTGLNHYAWEVESLATLGALGDVLARNGGALRLGTGAPRRRPQHLHLPLRPGRGDRRVLRRHVPGLGRGDVRARALEHRGPGVREPLGARPAARDDGDGDAAALSAAARAAQCGRSTYTRRLSSSPLAPRCRIATDGTRWLWPSG